jgi:hypothetical protein
MATPCPRSWLSFYVLYLSCNRCIFIAREVEVNTRVKVEGKGKVYPITGHEDPEEE